MVKVNLCVKRVVRTMLRALLLGFPIWFMACASDQQVNSVSSPNSKNTISIELDETGGVFYGVSHQGFKVLDHSRLGFLLKDLSLKDGFEIIGSEITGEKNTWKTVWGEREEVLDHYNQLVLSLKQKESGLLLNVYARAFDDGVALRYGFPEQEGLKDFVIMDELTEFNFSSDYSAWWNFADYDNYEKVYYNSPISQVGDSVKFERRIGKEERANMANTPFTVEVNDNLVVSIHEADLTDYAGMNLLNTLKGTKLKAHLTPWLNGDLVRTSAPMKSPWRTIQIGENAGELVESNMIMNLNPPCAYENTDWIETYKYIGIWWEMHTARTAWAEKKQFGKPLPKDRPHGATTENAKYHIDFAAKNGIKDVLIEGWDKGWDNMEADWKGYEIFDWSTSTDDFDLHEVCKYAKDKGVRMMMYHETISDIDHYEPRMDTLYKMCKDLGIKTVKVGYTGDVNWNKETKSYRQHHHGQYMVRHYKKMVQTAAKYQLQIINHEPIKYTGEQRTYPNLMAREGARGMEYNAWSVGNSPEHTLVLPFTRNLGGPNDYTVGIFEPMLPQRAWAPYEIRVRTTVAKQLAYFLTIYSPIPMAADLPVHYEARTEIFQFVKDVATNWSESKVLNAKIGDYFTVVRRERGTDNWYLGSMTDEETRNFNIDLSFLKEDVQYEATIYADGKDADWVTNPYPVEIIKRKVTSKDTHEIKLATSGGQVIIFKAL